MSELPASSTPTNAQRIRSTSDEELAELLSQIAYARYTPWAEPFSRTFCDDCPVTTVKLEGYYHEVDLHECDCTDGKCPYGSDIVYWLQQPAETEGKKCDRFFIDDGVQCSADSCWDVDRKDYRIGVKCGGDKTKCCLSDRCT